MKVITSRVLSDHGKQYRVGDEITGWDEAKVAAFAAKGLVRVYEQAADFLVPVPPPVEDAPAETVEPVAVETPKRSKGKK